MPLTVPRQPAVPQADDLLRAVVIEQRRAIGEAHDQGCIRRVGDDGVGFAQFAIAPRFSGRDERVDAMNQPRTGRALAIDINGPIKASMVFLNGLRFIADGRAQIQRLPMRLAYAAMPCEDAVPKVAPGLDCDSSSIPRYAAFPQRIRSPSLRWLSSTLALTIARIER